MKNTIAILAATILVSIISASCTKKSNSGQNSNNGITLSSHGPYEITFDDSSAAASWVFSDSTDSVYTNVTSGLFQYVNNSRAKSSTRLFDYAAIAFRNFTASARIKSNNTMGLTVAALPADPYRTTESNGYVFYIDTAGNYSFYNEGDDKTPRTVIIPPTPDNSIVKSDWNTLELDHVDDSSLWVGYINSKRVFTVAALANIFSSDNYCGFTVQPATTGYAQYLTVTGAWYRQ